MSSGIDRTKHCSMLRQGGQPEQVADGEAEVHGYLVAGFAGAESGTKRPTNHLSASVTKTSPVSLSFSTLGRNPLSVEVTVMTENLFLRLRL